MKTHVRCIAYVLLITAAVSHLKAQTTYYRKSLEIPALTIVRTSHQSTLDGGTIVITQSYDANSMTNITLVKLNAAGNIQWNRHFGPLNSECANVVQCPDSGYFFSCLFPGSLNNWYDVVKVDKNGNLVFMKHLATPVAQMYPGTPGISLARNNGGFYIAGNVVDMNLQQNRWHLMELDANGNVVLSTIYDMAMSKSPCTDIDTCTNGDIVIVGQGLDQAFGTFNPVILKVNPAGNIIWYKQYATNPFHVKLNALQIDDQNNFHIAGESFNNASFLTDGIYMKTDSSGNVIHSFRYYTANNAFTFRDIMIVEDSNLVLAGGYYMLKIDTGGLPIYTRQFVQDDFFSFDTLTGPIYTLCGSDGPTPYATFQTTDKNGMSCEGTAVNIIKTGFTYTDSNLTGANPLPFSDSAMFPIVPPTTIHFQQTCSILLSSPELTEKNQVYPNPANTEILVQTSTRWNRIELIDLNGKVVRVNENESQPPVLDVSDLPNGVYVLRIYAEEGLQQQKITVLHQ